MKHICKLSMPALLTLLLCVNTISAKELTPIEPPASDGKIHPGNMCQPTQGWQSDEFYTHVWGIKNRKPDSASRWVICPILRDNTLNTDGLWTLNSTLSESVVVRVRNTEGNKVECQLHSLSKYSISMAIDTVSTTTWGDQELALTVRKSESGGGAYSLLCSLPYNGMVHNYWVREYSPTDPN